MTSEPQVKQQGEHFSMNKKNKSHEILCKFDIVGIFPWHFISFILGKSDFKFLNMKFIYI